MKKRTIKKTSPELKEALKNEIAPLLIGLRNDIKDTNDRLEKIVKANDNMQAADIWRLLRGQDGETPIRGKHYWTAEDKAEVIKEATPVLGKDYFTKAEQEAFLKSCTPQKGVHYNDGYTPVIGKDYFTDTEKAEFIKQILKQATPIKGVHYRDGHDGVTKTIKESVNMTPEAIRDALESLRGGSRLSVSALKDFRPEVLKLIEAYGGKGQGATAIGAGSSSGGTQYWQLANSTISPVNSYDISVSMGTFTGVNTIIGTDIVSHTPSNTQGAIADPSPYWIRQIGWAITAASPAGYLAVYSTSIATQASFFQSNSSLVIGRKYRVTYTIVAKTGTWSSGEGVKMQLGNTAEASFSSTLGVHTADIICSSNNNVLILAKSTTATAKTISVGDITCKELDTIGVYSPNATGYFGSIRDLGLTAGRIPFTDTGGLLSDGAYWNKASQFLGVGVAPVSYLQVQMGSTPNNMHFRYGNYGMTLYAGTSTASGTQDISVQGSSTYLVASNNHYFANPSGMQRIGVNDNGVRIENTGINNMARTRLDVIATADQQFDYLQVSGTANIEQPSTDRNRLFLGNTDGSNGSISSEIMWHSVTKDGYATPVQNYSFGNDWDKNTSQNLYMYDIVNNRRFFFYDGGSATLTLDSQVTVTGTLTADIFRPNTNYKSADGSDGVSMTCTVKIGGVDKNMTIKNGIVTSIA